MEGRPLSWRPLGKDSEVEAGLARYVVSRDLCRAATS
jgi:hypothetical protein